MRISLLLLTIPIFAADYSAPAGIRPALRRPGATSILPGGRIISPLGNQYVTGPGPFGLAISASGRTMVSANRGPDRFSLTVLEQDKSGAWSVRQLIAPKKKPVEKEGDREKDDEGWHSVFMGLAFATEHSVYASEGNSGRVRLVDLATGGAKKIYDLNQDGFEDSFTGDLAFDADRGVIYVLDQANFRMVAIDVRKQRVLVFGSPGPLAVRPGALAGQTQSLCDEYRNVRISSRCPAWNVTTPARRPCLFQPSDSHRPKRATGARRETARGPVDVPGLGDPNAREANSLAVIALDDPAALKVEALIRTGLPFGAGTDGGSRPSGVVATGGSRLRFQWAQRFHHRDRCRRPTASPGRSRSDSRPRKAARRDAHRDGLRRKHRLAAGGRGGHQRGGRDRYAAVAAKQCDRASAGRLVSEPRADR